MDIKDYIKNNVDGGVRDCFELFKALHKEYGIEVTKKDFILYIKGLL